MLDIKGIRTESRKEMYLKYTKSSYFSTLQNKDKPEKVTGKITNIPYLNKFVPSYDKKNARERYMKDFWDNEKYKFPVVNKKEKPNQKLNANDIVCRDLYSGCNALEYKKRLGKPMFLKRSYTCSNLETAANMTSRLRKIYNMSSDIFFTERNQDKKEESNNNQKKNLIERMRHRKTISISYQKKPELYTKTNNPQINKKYHHSRYASNSDWRYTNTEESLTRSKTVDPSLKRKFFRKNLVTTGEENSDQATIYLNTESTSFSSKTGLCNTESVNYDIISSKKNMHKKSISVLSGQPARPGEIEHYEICVDSKFDGANARYLKNLFYSEGIHLFKFEEKGSGVNGFKNGKFTFRIRKNDLDKNYDKKMDLIKTKIKNKNMKMVKLGDSHIRSM